MDGGHRIGPGEDQGFVAAFELGATEIVGAQPASCRLVPMAPSKMTTRSAVASR